MTNVGEPKTKIWIDQTRIEHWGLVGLFERTVGNPMTPFIAVPTRILVIDDSKCLIIILPHH
jgi:hypothetical protein